jgi:hypothetical protein
MVKVKPIDLTLPTRTDAIRSLFYSVLPIFCIASIWILGYATSLESKVTSEDRTRNGYPTATATTPGMNQPPDFGMRQGPEMTADIERN